MTAYASVWVYCMTLHISAQPSHSHLTVSKLFLQPLKLTYSFMLPARVSCHKLLFNYFDPEIIGAIYSSIISAIPQYVQFSCHTVQCCIVEKSHDMQTHCQIHHSSQLYCCYSYVHGYKAERSIAGRDGSIWQQWYIIPHMTDFLLTECQNVKSAKLLLAPEGKQHTFLLKIVIIQNPPDF